MLSVNHGLSKPCRQLVAAGRDYGSRFPCATKNRRREYLWEMAYKEGVNSDFFCPSTFTACNAGCSVNGLWLSKSFPLTNPCIQLCRGANKRSRMDFRHSSLETDPLASASRPSSESTLATWAAAVLPDAQRSPRIVRSPWLGSGCLRGFGVYGVDQELFLASYCVLGRATASPLSNGKVAAVHGLTDRRTQKPAHASVPHAQPP